MLRKATFFSMEKRKSRARKRHC
uniref:Uncharacterized protein n=1 Tax=Rhizophora mucronata TaxID=61149 RepID=A0A2P2QCK9_RHIMU